MIRAQVYEAPEGLAPPNPLPTDDYFSKLVKYIPGETIAFFAPISAFIGVDNPKILVVLILGAIGTLGWVWGSGQKVPSGQGPRFYTYVLALSAFVAWAIGISVGVRHLFGSLSDDWAGIVLAGAAFLIPFADLALTGWWNRRHAQPGVPNRGSRPVA